MTFITKLSDGRFAAHNSYHGPFNTSGATKYIPLLNSSLRTLGMAKATLSSPGDGDWSQVGADIAISGSSDVVCVYAAHDPGNNRICVGTAQANGTFRYHQFSTSSETWTISDELIRQVDGGGDYTTASAVPMLAVSYRADGDVTVVHNGYDTGGAHYAAYRAIRTTSWAALTKVQAHAAEISGIGGSEPTDSGANDERTNFLYGRGPNDARRWHYNDGTTVDTENATSSIDSADVLVGRGVKDAADDVWFPIVGADNNVHVITWDGTDDASSVSPSDVGAVSDNTVAWNGASTKPFPPMCLVYDGTDVHLIYSADTDDDIRWNDDATSTGGTETTVVSGITCHHLSAGMSADNNSILLIYSDGNAIPIFTKIALSGTVTKNFPLSSFLIGLRPLPLLPDEPPPPPDSNLVLPPVEGQTLWQQSWGQCLLIPLSLSGGATWDADTRGALNFGDTGANELCVAPGRMRANAKVSGTMATVFDSEINGNANRITATREQYQTLDSLDRRRNHTDFELHADNLDWNNDGRAWLPLREYKVSFLVKLRTGFNLTNPQWTIIMQAFGFGDDGDAGRNPWMAPTVLDGRWVINLRGDSRFILENSDYEFPNQSNGPTRMDLGAVAVDTWELFEIWFNYDYRRTGAVGEGNAYCVVHRNGVPRLNIQGIQLGYNDAAGSLMRFGIYHNFTGPSIANTLSLDMGPVRFERIA